MGAVNNWRKRLHYDATAKIVSVDCLNMCRSRSRGLDFFSGSTIFLPSVYPRIHDVGIHHGHVRVSTWMAHVWNMRSRLLSVHQEHSIHVPLLDHSMIFSFGKPPS